MDEWTDSQKEAFQTAAAMLLASVRSDWDAVNVLAQGHTGDPAEIIEAMMNIATYAMTQLAVTQGRDPVEFSETFVRISAEGLFGG